jgi:tetratricopeptide (TPR) repeat protein
VTSDRLKTALLFLVLPGSCLVAETLGLLSSALIFSSPAQAADFAHAKQIIVPASRIRRRYDSEVRETSGYSMNPNNGSAMDGYSSYSQGGLAPAPAPFNISFPQGSASTPKPSKNGLIPPPPAVTPSIIAPPMSMMTPMSQPVAASPRVGFEALNTPQARAMTAQAAHAAAQLDSLLKEGKFTEAQALIKSYLKNFPKDKILKSEFVQTLIANGKAWVASKDFDDAIKAAREALSIEPGSTTATAMLNDWLKKKGVDHASDNVRLRLADTLAREGKNSEALVEYRAALKIKPTAEAHIGAGSMLFKEGKKETAKAEFQKALELDPNSGAALRQLGSLRYTQGDVIGANNDLSRALIINSEDKVAGRTLIDLWHRQVAKNPRDASQHLGLARAYQLSGDLKSAQNEYKQVVRLEPDNPNLPAARQSFKLALARQEAMKAYQAAQTLDAHGAIREAHSKIVEASGIAPTDVKIRLYEGDLATRLGLYSQAHDAYMTVIREEPKNVMAAKKLQELAAKTQATTMIMPPTAPQANGLASPQVITFLNQNQFSPPPSILAQMTSQVRPGELPPALTLPRPVGSAAAAAVTAAAKPLPTDGDVSSLSGFLGQLRGYQQTEKERLQKQEDAIHKALGYKSSDSGSGGASLNLPPLPPLPALPPLPSALTTETPVTAGAAVTTTTTAASAPAAAAPSAPAPPVSNTLAGLALKTFPGGLSSANLATAAQAVPQLMSGGFKAMSSADVSAATAMAASAAASRLGLAPKDSTPAASSAAAAAAKSVMPQTSPAPGSTQGLQQAYQRIGSLEEQNRQLASQLAQAHSALKTITPPVSPTPGTPRDLVPAPMTAPVQVPPQPDLLPPVSPVPQAAPDFSRAKAPSTQGLSPDLLANLPSLPPNVQAAMVKGLTPEQLAGLKQTMQANANNTRGTVRFELEGVVPSRSQIKLKVVLKNDRDFPMELPPTISAKIQMPGKPEQYAKVEFSGKQINAHGEIHGVIKVPGRDLNASADVSLPNFLPPSEQYRDVHLTVPISKL